LQHGNYSSRQTARTSVEPRRRARNALHLILVMPRV
jgi:hypothetical protein